MDEKYKKLEDDYNNLNNKDNEEIKKKEEENNKLDFKMKNMEKELSEIKDENIKNQDNIKDLLKYKDMYNNKNQLYEKLNNAFQDLNNKLEEANLKIKEQNDLTNNYKLKNDELAKSYEEEINKLKDENTHKIQIINKNREDFENKYKILLKNKNDELENLKNEINLKENENKQIIDNSNKLRSKNRIMNQQLEKKYENLLVQKDNEIESLQNKLVQINNELENEKKIKINKMNNDINQKRNKLNNDILFLENQIDLFEVEKKAFQKEKAKFQQSNNRNQINIQFNKRNNDMNNNINNNNNIFLSQPTPQMNNYMNNNIQNMGMNTMNNNMNMSNIIQNNNMNINNMNNINSNLNNMNQKTYNMNNINMNLNNMSMNNMNNNNINMSNIITPNNSIDMNNMNMSMNNMNMNSFNNANNMSFNNNFNINNNINNMNYNTYNNLNKNLMNMGMPTLNNNNINNNFSINNNNRINTQNLQNIQTPPLIGLNNIGATCFMNATLQCLSQTYKLSNFFLQEKNRDRIINNNIAKENKGELQLSPSYLELIQHLWNKDEPKGEYSPNKIRFMIEQLNSLFKPNTPGDSKDFIIFIFTQLQKELCRPAPGYKEENIIVNQYNRELTLKNFVNEFQKGVSIITDLFFGFIETQNVCLDCKNRCNGKNYPICYNFQVFNNIIFPLEKVLEMKRMKLNNYQLTSVNLMDCFEQYQQVEHFRGENKNQCNICKQLSDADYTTYIYSPPNIFVLILNRGKDNVHKIKLDFDEVIDITQFIKCKKYNEIFIYSLYGVITHIGESGPNAHFVASCKSSIDNKWYRFNDAIVNPINNIQKEIFDYGNPYILFYKKVELK